MGTLADRLRTARARHFVGRAQELTTFARALTEDPPPFTVLWLCGPGGIGKSTLVRRFADEASARGADVRLVDGAQIDASPRGLTAAVGPLPVAGSPDDARRLVLLLDSVEAVHALDTWLREDYLPALPETAVVVLAGRRPPGQPWRTDLGWAEHLRVVALEALAPGEAADYLDRRGVDTASSPGLVQASRGHPLALALLADVALQNPAPARHSDAAAREAAGNPLASSAELVAALLERFVGEVADPVQRHGLQLLGHVRVTTEPLLAAALGDPAPAAECFGWLRSLSFVQAAPTGLAPHDLARDVLDCDLRWRDPDGWLRLRRTVRAAYLQRVGGDDARLRGRAVADLLWLHRDSPSLRAYPSWDEAFALWWEPATRDDVPAILALVQRHEGRESVELHQRWWSAQPGAFCVIRSRPREVHGFLLTPRLDATGEPAGLLAADPFASAALDHVRAVAPLRGSEHLRMVRSWMGVDGYHTPSPTHQALTGATTTAWLSERGLAVSVSFMAHEAGTTDPWQPMFEHVGYVRAADADVAFAGRSYAAYVHDWRVQSPLEWLDALGRRQDRGDAAPGPGPAAGAGRAGSAASGSRVVLPREDFERWVREGLRTAGDPRALANNPLSGSRLVTEDPSGSLRTVLTSAVDRLRARPRGEREARVLEVTYLARAATQEAAAARLSLSFSTYRRVLAAALAAVVDDLWHRELHG